MLILLSATENTHSVQHYWQKPTVQWTPHTWLVPEKQSAARPYKSCFTCQRWRWCATIQPPARCQSRLMSGGGQLHQQPEHLLVGVASATWTFLCLIRPYRLWVESHFSPPLLFLRDATESLNGKVNIYFVAPRAHVNSFFLSLKFSGSAYYSGTVLVQEFDFLESIPDKASAGHVKVNIMVYIQICHRLWVDWVYLCFYRKTHFDRALSLPANLWLIRERDAYKQKSRQREKQRNRLREKKWYKAKFYMSRLWPFLAPEKHDAAGGPAVLVPPPPPPAWLALLFEFLQCDKKPAEREGPRPWCTRRPLGISRVAFSIHSIQFSICKRVEKRERETSADSVNNFWFLYKWNYFLDVMTQSLRKHLSCRQFCKRHFILNETELIHFIQLILTSRFSDTAAIQNPIQAVYAMWVLEMLNVNSPVLRIKNMHNYTSPIVGRWVTKHFWDGKWRMGSGIQ